MLLLSLAIVADIYGNFLVRLVILAILAFFFQVFLCLWLRKKLRESLFDELNRAEVTCNDVRKFASVTAATDGFSTQNLLGKGGFGPVFKANKTSTLCSLSFGLNHKNGK
ncbi:Concanavalin A-like lectin/glucanase domain containing protein, partial [Trema orientale]